MGGEVLRSTLKHTTLINLVCVSVMQDLGGTLSFGASSSCCNWFVSVQCCCTSVLLQSLCGEPPPEEE